MMIKMINDNDIGNDVDNDNNDNDNDDYKTNNSEDFT